MGNTCI